MTTFPAMFEMKVSRDGTINRVIDLQERQIALKERELCQVQSW